MYITHSLTIVPSIALAGVPDIKVTLLARLHTFETVITVKTEREIRRTTEM